MTGGDAPYVEQVVYRALSTGLPRARGGNLRVPAESRAAARVGLLEFADLDAAMQAFAMTYADLGGVTVAPERSGVRDVLLNAYGPPGGGQFHMPMRVGTIETMVLRVFQAPRAF